MDLKMKALQNRMKNTRASRYLHQFLDLAKADVEMIDVVFPELKPPAECSGKRSRDPFTYTRSRRGKSALERDHRIQGSGDRREADRGRKLISIEGKLTDVSVL